MFSLRAKLRKEKPMTLEEIKASDKTMLTPVDVSKVLGCAPYSINQQVKADASKLGFPVMMCGRRVKIPRLAFIAFIEGRTYAS